MKKLSQYLLACCLATIGFMPSDAFASYALTVVNNSLQREILASSTLYFSSNNPPLIFDRPEYASTLVIPATGRITAVYGNIFIAEAVSFEACTINIIQNGTIKTQVTNSFVFGAAGYNPFSNNTLNLAVTAGDVLQMQIITPAWAKGPNCSGFSVSIYIE